MTFTLDLSTVWTALAALIAIDLLIWFLTGMQVNLARGNAALRWLKSGLPVVAERAPVQSGLPPGDARAAQLAGR